MKEFFKRPAIRVLAPVVLALASSAALTGAAWAGADDGGNKAFFGIPGPGPSAASQPQYTAPQPRYGEGPTATFNDSAYESYRTQPQPSHHGRHHNRTN